VEIHTRFLKTPILTKKYKRPPKCLKNASFLYVVWEIVKAFVAIAALPQWPDNVCKIDSKIKKIIIVELKTKRSYKVKCYLS
jgi:hypothetical protein